MKIWVIGRDYPSSQNRLRGSFEIEQAKMLARGGHDVTYLCVSFHPKRKIRNWGYASWKEEGITVCAYSQIFFPERFHIRMDWLCSRAWKKLLSQAEQTVGLPELIHVHYPAMITDPKAILAYQKQGIRIVVTEHWTKVLSKKLNAAESAQLSAYTEHADGFICVGEPLRKSILEQTGTKRPLTVVPNVVDSIFQPQETARSADEPYTFVTAARLVKVKQIDKVIEAVAALRKQGVKLRYLVIGDGTERAALEALTQRLGMQDTVHFYGAQPKEQVAKIVAQSDCLICYSSLETFGVPIIEAWASGIPVISSDCLGLAEYWQDGLGYIVSYKDLSELTDRMKQIMTEPEKYDKQRLAEYARTHFSESVIRGKIENVYRQ